MVNAICGLLFACFCFCYLMFFQSDYLAFVQHFYSDGRNVNHGYVFPVIISTMLTMLGYVLLHFFHLPIRLRALHWMPSILILGMFSGFPIGRFTQSCQSFGVMAYIVFFLLFCVVYYVAMIVRESRSENSSFFMLAWPNLLIHCCGFWFVGYAGNTCELFQKELRVERAVGEGRWEDALEMINAQENTTRTMTSLIAYSLDCQGALGERFFQCVPENWDGNLLPLPGDSLRPWNFVALYKERLGGFPGTDMKASNYLEYLSRDTIATDRVPDFLLTAYLVDRNLDDFVHKMLVYYPPIDSMTHVYAAADSLPLHFREAVCQYGLTVDKPLVSLDDSLLSARFVDFDSLRVRVPESASAMDSCLSVYKGTYWYYYFLQKR